MYTLHDHLLNQVVQERARLISRRAVLAGGTSLLAGVAAIGVAPGGSIFPAVALAQTTSPFANDIEILNFALTLELMEAALYRDGVGLFTFGFDGFGNDIGAWLAAAGKHENTHVSTLTQVIAGLGGVPVAEAIYNFGYTDAQSFLTTAAALENVGVAAYDGAGRYLKDLGLITAAAAIVAVEARHAAYLNLITGANPFPDAIEPVSDADAVHKAIDPFVRP